MFVVASLNDEFMGSLRYVLEVVHLEEHRAAVKFDRAFGEERGEGSLFQCGLFPVDDHGFIGIAHADDQQGGVKSDPDVLPAIREESNGLWPVGRCESNRGQYRVRWVFVLGAALDFLHHAVFADAFLVVQGRASRCRIHQSAAAGTCRGSALGVNGQ